MYGGGRLTNTASAVISNSAPGRAVYGDVGTIVNDGTIVESVTMSGGAYLGNLAGGVITNATTAIVGIGGANTVTDADTISGGISFAGTGGNLLVLEQGYKLTGQVAASGSGNILELRGSAGAPVTVNFNALSLTNFGTVRFGPGSYETLIIANSATLPGTIAGFTTLHDTIDLTQLSDAGNDAVTSFNTLTDVLTATGDNGIAVGVVLSGGLVDLASGSVVSGAIDFRSVSGGRLMIDDQVMPTNVISGLTPGDTFDLANIPFDSVGGVTLVNSGGVNNQLQITAGGTTLTFNLDPAQDFNGATFQLATDSVNGTLVTENLDPTQNFFVPLLFSG